METAEVVRVEAWSCGDSESRSLSDLSFSAPDSWPLRRSRPPRLHYADVALGNIAREGRRAMPIAVKRRLRQDGEKVFQR